MPANKYLVGKDGIYRPPFSLQHRNEEYEEEGFETLWAMQQKHFWYRGRHRFLLAALDRYCPTAEAVIDLGGGVGGWLHYLTERRCGQYRTLALADSSSVALHRAAAILPQQIERYQIDLMRLEWDGCWDIAFLLDVIEHLPDDLGVIEQARQALKPGGYLLVTTPALQQFWSYNDEAAHHLRRYTRNDFKRLAEQSGLELCDARYFMFFLSPLYWLTRRRATMIEMSEAEKRETARNAHKIPPAPINGVLTAIFGAEVPIGHWLPFPWGTSVLGVFRKI